LIVVFRRDRAECSIGSDPPFTLNRPGARHNGISRTMAPPRTVCRFRLIETNGNAAAQNSRFCVSVDFCGAGLSLSNWTHPRRSSNIKWPSFLDSDRRFTALAPGSCARFLFSWVFLVSKNSNQSALMESACGCFPRREWGAFQHPIQGSAFPDIDVRIV
jgi:hypothetical protein